MVTNTTAGYCLSAAVVSIASSVLVVVKDTTPPLKIWMASLFGHHWTTHGVFVVIVFLLLGFLFSKMNWVQKLSEEKVTSSLLWSAIIGTVIVTGFYLSHW